MSLRKTLAIISLLISTSLRSQIAPGVYLVQLTDKEGSPYSIDKPRDFLSQRAINRRFRNSIPVTKQDLPVNPSYIEEIRKYAEIRTISKWFNSVSIQTDNDSILETIRSLPFVRSIKNISGKNQSNVNKLPFNNFKSRNDFPSLPDTSFFDYGQGARQIGMLGGHVLHNQGYQGQGLVIAVLDGGFSKADINPVFDSLWNNGQILGSWDFVENAPLTFDKHPHGAQVLSIMAANVPGRLVGSAPKASYYLLRTENGNYELPIEEEFWITGAEYADSAGADLINSSLSYTLYNDPFTSHTYEELDGNTTRVSIAADIAASKGLLVVTSAGNYAEDEWRYIGAPADADSVLAVGAVNADGNYASFSSTGPSSDGRIRPVLAAQGKDTYYAATNGDIYVGSGTSFSAPIICGLAACLWQASGSAGNMELLNMIIESCSNRDNPDNLTGYGLPDFSGAFFRLQGIDTENIKEGNYFRVFPNPFYNSFTLDYISPHQLPLRFELWDIAGRKILSNSYDPGYGAYLRIKLTGLDNLNPGIYIGRIISDESVQEFRIMRSRTRL
jgi:hypothetical protein